jgi:hypothetical protein
MGSLRCCRGPLLPFLEAPLSFTAPSAHLLPVIVWIAELMESKQSHDEIAAGLLASEANFFACPIVPGSRETRSCRGSASTQSLSTHNDSIATRTFHRFMSDTSSDARARTRARVALLDMHDQARARACISMES